MYSDNVLSGAHSLEEALHKQDELIHLFKQGHLNLHIENTSLKLSFAKRSVPSRIACCDYCKNHYAVVVDS